MSNTRSLLATGIAVVTSVLVPTAAAGGPVITFNNDPAPRAVPDWADCSGFQIDATFMARRRNETFYDSSGQAVLQRRHVQFTGTLFNASDPSKSVVYTGDFTRTFDYATGVLRLDGLDSHAVMPGKGVIEVNAGNSMFSPTDVIVRGPDGDVTQLCDALS